VGPERDRRADAFSLIAAIEEIRKRRISIVNLSLSGPDNEPLRQAVEEAGASGVHLIAAVGIAGPASNALYPAGYDDVIAVTALDQQLRVYRRAVRGAHVDFSAPGVEVSSAGSGNRRSRHSGASFSTPFVTAAVVAALSKQTDMRPAETIAMLAGLAKDLGSVGKDNVFGYGLVCQHPVCHSEPE
jgi:minor extracellular protease Epr